MGNRSKLTVSFELNDYAGAPYLIKCTSGFSELHKIFHRNVCYTQLKYDVVGELLIKKISYILMS